MPRTLVEHDATQWPSLSTVSSPSSNTSSPSSFRKKSPNSWHWRSRTINVFPSSMTNVPRGAGCYKKLIEKRVASRQIILFITAHYSFSQTLSHYSHLKACLHSTYQITALSTRSILLPWHSFLNVLWLHSSRQLTALRWLLKNIPGKISSYIRIQCFSVLHGHWQLSCQSTSVVYFVITWQHWKNWKIGESMPTTQS